VIEVATDALVGGQEVRHGFGLLIVGGARVLLFLEEILDLIFVYLDRT
jgi:hypothetical protein